MSTYENKLAADFLLGRLDDYTRDTFEENFVTDKDIYNELLQAENDLIDDFVSGDMSAADRDRFKANFFANERQRQKVVYSRALMAYSSGKAAVVPAAGFRKWLSTLFSIQPAFAAVAAAVLLCVIGGLLFLARFEEGDFRAGTASPETFPNAPPPAPAAPVAPSTDSADQAKEPPPPVTPVHPQRRPAMPRTEKAPSKEPSALMVISTIILRPGMTRGSNEQTLAASFKKTGWLRLQMDAPSGAGEFQSYAVIVETVAGEQVWNRKVRKSSGPVFTVVPNRLLQKGEYIVTLKGIAANGAADTLNEYTFSIR